MKEHSLRDRTPEEEAVYQRHLVHETLRNAAPEMLDALKLVFYQKVGLSLASKVSENGWRWPDDSPRQVSLLDEAIRAAIAKAEGKS